MEALNPDLLDPPAAAAYLHVSASYLAKLRCWGGGPKYLKPGRHVVYRKVDLDAWLNARVRRSTSEEVA